MIDAFLSILVTLVVGGWSLWLLLIELRSCQRHRRATRPQRRGFEVIRK